MSRFARVITRAPLAAAVLAVGVAVSFAAEASPPSDDEPRSVLFINVDSCPSDYSTGRLTLSYDDLVDGHTPQQVTERLADQSGELWSSTDLHEVDGDYFNSHELEWPTEIPITSSSVFTYTLTIAYDDGVTQTQSVNLSMADVCGTGSPTTAAPGPRFTLSKTGVRCGDSLESASIEFLFEDTVDQHVAVEYFYRLTAGDTVVAESGGQATSPSDGLTEYITEPGGFLGVDRLEAATYTLTVWMKYEDGVLVSDSASYDVAALCSIDGAASSPPTTEAVPVATEDHPLVGAWVLTRDAEVDSPPVLGAFSSDGIYHQVAVDGVGGYGTWEATGDSSAALTFVQQFADETGSLVRSATIRATIEVNPDGLGFTGEYTVEMSGEGTPPGEFGLGTVTGARITVEPIGTPVGTLDELLSAFEDATVPEAPATTS